MVPPPQVFRLVYRAFDAFEFDPIKNDEIFAWRSCDIPYAVQMFPGYVLEGRDSRSVAEPRFQVIGAVFDEIFVLVFTTRGHRCRVITAWETERHELDLWYDHAR